MSLCELKEHFMSTSFALQRVMNSCILLSQTDIGEMKKDMSLALSESDKKIMPEIIKVINIVYCSEKGITPHISVYFIAKNEALYCWDLSVRISEKWDVETSEPIKVNLFYGSLTLMKMPEEINYKIPKNKEFDSQN